MNKWRLGLFGILVITILPGNAYATKNHSGSSDSGSSTQSSSPTGVDPLWWTFSKDQQYRITFCMMGAELYLGYKRHSAEWEAYVVNCSVHSGELDPSIVRQVLKSIR